MSAHRLLKDLFLDHNASDIPDPGDTGSIVVDRQFGYCPLVSAAAETRTLPIPTKPGIYLLLYMKTDGGDITLTATSGFDEAGNTTITFNDEGDYVQLVSVDDTTTADTYRWRVVGYDGCSGIGLNIDGTAVTATATEINTACDGITATAAEINAVADISGRLIDLDATTLAITAGTHGERIVTLSHTAALSTVTLPAASGTGDKYTFIVAAVNTNNHVIQVASASDIMQGQIITCSTGDTPDLAQPWTTAADSDTITLNGTTTGGQAVGDRIELIDMASGVWHVLGFTRTSGTEATPFSAAVS